MPTFSRQLGHLVPNCWRVFFDAHQTLERGEQREISQAEKPGWYTGSWKQETYRGETLLFTLSTGLVGARHQRALAKRAAGHYRWWMRAEAARCAHADRGVLLSLARDPSPTVRRLALAHPAMSDADRAFSALLG